jgi:hypothetical protein
VCSVKQSQSRVASDWGRSYKQTQFQKESQALRVKCEAGEPVRVLRVFLLQTSHFRLSAERRLPRANCAKQSQFPPEQQEEQVLCGEGVMVNRTRNRLRQNKANWGGVSSVKCQVLSWRSRWPSLHTSDFRRKADRPRRIVQNEPNFGDSASHRRAKRAKQTQFGGAGPSSQGTIVQNEANLGGVLSVKCQVLGWASRAASLGSLPTANFVLHT